MKRIGILYLAAVSALAFAGGSAALAVAVPVVMAAGVAVTPANLQAIQAGFSRIFNTTLTAMRAKDTSAWRKLSLVVPSMGASELYGYLKDIGGIREWLGDRQVKSLEAGSFEVVNKQFEETVGIKRTAIEDDKLGIYNPRVQQMAQNVEQFPHNKVIELLNKAESTRCYDGQELCDTDHPYIDAAGNPATQSNWGGGSGARWFLACTGKIGAKPVLVQEREKFNFRALVDLNNPHTFMKDELLFGTDGRYGFAPGFWQLIYGSRQPLTVASYEAARAAMMNFKRDGGDTLDVMPDTLIVGPSNEGIARDIVLANEIGATTNKWRGTAELIVVPGLI